VRAAASPCGRLEGGAEASYEPGLLRALEAQAAHLGSELRIAALEPEPPIEDADRAMADAMIVEYMLRAEIVYLFEGRPVPYGFPIGRLRSDIAERVAAMAPAERQGCLRPIAKYMPIQVPPSVSAPDSTNLWQDLPFEPELPPGWPVHKETL
jgi:hypothetical protein